LQVFPTTKRTLIEGQKRNRKKREKRRKRESNLNFLDECFPKQKGESMFTWGKGKSQIATSV